MSRVLASLCLGLLIIVSVRGTAAQGVQSLFPIIENDKWGLIDWNGKIVVPAQFDWVGDAWEGPSYMGERAYPWKSYPLRDELIVVMVGSKFGYIDRNGSIVIKPQFGAAHSFSQGLARVRAGNGRWGYIDRSGNLVIAPQFGEFIVGAPEDFSEGLALASGCTAPCPSEVWGFIDRKGDFAIKPQFIDATPFSEGLAAVAVGSPMTHKRMGYIDVTGKIVIPPKFDAAERFSEGLAVIQATGRFGYIDRSGGVVISPQFDEAGYFSEGLAPVNVGGLWGYIDRRGVKVIWPQFFRALHFSEGLAAVKIKTSAYTNVEGVFNVEGPFVGYIDRSGAMVIKPQFLEGFGFSDGRALVKLYDPNGALRSGYIDRSGKFVWGPVR
jgi:hypothetical protein